MIHTGTSIHRSANAERRHAVQTRMETPDDGYAGSSPASQEMNPAGIRQMRQRVATSGPGPLASQLKEALGLTEEQASRLVSISQSTSHLPGRAGRLENGEVFLVTVQDCSKDPASFQGYQKYFQVFFGPPDGVEQRQVLRAERMRDGGSTFIHADGVDLRFPVQGPATVNGSALTADIKF
jgi:hypothetical protein